MANVPTRGTFTLKMNETCIFVNAADFRYVLVHCFCGESWLWHYLGQLF